MRKKRETIKSWREGYFWAIIILLIVVALLAYPGESYLLKGDMADEWHINFLLLRGTLSLITVTLAAWRYGFKAGLGVWLIVGLVLLPHYLEELANSAAGITIMTHNGVLGAISLISIWLASIHGRAQKAVQESEAKYRHMVDNAIVGVATTNIQGDILYVNDAIVRMFEFESPEAMIAEGTLMRWADPKAREVFLEELQKKGRVEHYEVEFLTRTGKTRNIIMNTVRTDDTLATVLVEITESKEAEESIKQLNEYLQLQVSRMPIGLIVWNTEFRVQSWNPVAEKIFGFSSAEALGKHPYDIIVPKEAQPYVDGIWSRLLEGDMTACSVNENITKDGRIIICDWANTPLKKDDTTVVGVLSMVQDITERQQAEEQIRRSGEFFKAVFNSAHDAISILNVGDYTITAANTAFLELYGLTEAEVIGKTCYQITHHRSEPCTLPDDICPLLHTLATGESSLVEHTHYTDKGKKVYMEVSVAPIRYENASIIQVVHVSRDITQRKEAEKRIQASLHEKEELLREMHHRVKNNLQITASLLGLQAEGTTDKKTIEMFQVAQRRVRAMAYIHEMLSQSPGIVRIDFETYTREIARYLVDSYTITPGTISLEVDVEKGISLGVSTATSCGLIINELVSNALKYAFPGGREGQIRIALKRQEDDKLLLTVSDNGIGFPQDLDFRTTCSLGMQLVINLTQQLKGTIDLNRAKRTEWRILFTRQD